MAFEGTEKKVEITVSSAAGSFRELGYAFWKDIVKSARAEILSHRSSPRIDAYLLSESSLFVEDRRLVMITCGQTRLVDAVSRLLETVPSGQLATLIYERKNENFPESQPTTFDEDVDQFRTFIPGTTHVFGEPDDHHLSLFHLDRPYTPAPDDETVEILMYDLDPAARAVYQKQAGKGGSPLWRGLGLDTAFPDYAWDDHVFHPSGYSLNGISPGAGYATVHITPDDPGSYASFETNQVLSGDELTGVLRELLSRLQPTRYDIILFQDGQDLDLPQELGQLVSAERRRLACGYPVHFLHFRHRRR